MICRRNILIAATAIGVAACTTYPSYGPGPPIRGAAHINAATKGPYGSYLVDGAGRALYLLDGQRHNAGMDRCMGECLRIWPPVHTSGPPTAGPGGRLPEVYHRQHVRLQINQWRGLGSDPVFRPSNRTPENRV